MVRFSMEADAEGRVTVQVLCDDKVDTAALLAAQVLVQIKKLMPSAVVVRATQGVGDDGVLLLQRESG